MTRKLHFHCTETKKDMANSCDLVALPGENVAPPTSSLFQCKHAINAYMRKIVDRHLTPGEYWPSERIEADSTLLVDAGFCYLGEGDQVKCWYCSGGLKNWHRFENPWTIHAKWFQLCEYLLRNKGVDLSKTS